MQTLPEISEVLDGSAGVDVEDVAKIMEAP